MRDPDLDRRLRNDGYAVIELMDAKATAALLQLCEELHPAATTTWESDFYSNNAADKRRAHGGISRAMAPGIDRALVDHRTLVHNFIVNWPGPDGGLALHQHSSVVDESRFRSVFAWCALTPATEANGTLHVVPGSHRVQRGPRPERSSSWFEVYEEQLLSEHLVSVPLEPGQAIIFDNQLLHCSFPNTTGEPRMTAGAIVIPNSAEPSFYESVDDSTVRVRRLDPEFFLRNEAGDGVWADPDELEILRTEAWAPTVVDQPTFDSLFRSGTCRHSRT